jgi:hypothetical protein
MISEKKSLGRELAKAKASSQAITMFASGVNLSDISKLPPNSDPVRELVLYSLIITVSLNHAR